MLAEVPATRGDAQWVPSDASLDLARTRAGWAHAVQERAPRGAHPSSSLCPHQLVLMRDVLGIERLKVGKHLLEAHDIASFLLELALAVGHNNLHDDIVAE